MCMLYSLHTMNQTYWEEPAGGPRSLETGTSRGMRCVTVVALSTEKNSIVTGSVYTAAS